MILFDEQLIPNLCDDHLWQLWSDSHLIYYVIKGNSWTEKEEAREALSEFAGCPLEIAFRLNVVREELNKRGHPIKQTISPFDVSETPFLQYMKEKKRYTPRLTIEEQKRLLQEQKCKCSV